MKFIKMYEQYINNINENFWKWFRNSKITNNNKEPLILYHGAKTKFNIFKPSTHIGNQGEKDQIEGIYFTTSKTAASFFSISHENDERFIKPVFLSIQNPYYSNTIKDLKKELNIKKLKNVKEKLEKLGYDGLILKKGFQAYGTHKLYLAFYPNQVKSIRNDGSWDLDDYNIYS